MNEAEFLEQLWDYYARHGRHDLPWRLPEATADPYRIMVSEIMLQQTQVARVLPKYQAFLERFPTARQLADAELGSVLQSWSGLGYNRRAKFLWQAAQQVAIAFPQDLPGLVALPGIGANTAGAMLAYAYNQPALFIETNIRTVYIHHFFADDDVVSDQAIRDLLQATLDHEHPREFYWALMDYGSFLKQTVGNRSRQAQNYSTQSTFAGSRRQIRGQVLKLLTIQPQSLAALQATISDARLVAVVADLRQESLIKGSDTMYHL